MTLSARFNNFTMMLPEKGPLSVPDKITFVQDVEQEIDLTQLIDNGWLDYVSGVYIDNVENTGDLIFTCNGTNQRFFFPAGYAGYVPLFLPNPPKVKITSSENGTVTFQWYNVPVFPLLLPGPNVQTPITNVNIESVGGSAVTDPLAVSGPLTDTELRATAVNVLGPLTDTELRASPLDVLGPLTDTELRASPLDVDTGEIFQGSYIDRSIANLSGVSEQLMAANINRRILIVHNLGATSVAVNLTGGAASLTVAGSIVLISGASMIIDSFPPTSAINIIGTLNADVTAYEG